MDTIVENGYDSIIWSGDEPDIMSLILQLEKMPELRVIKIDAAFIEENEWDVFTILRYCYPYLKIFDDAKLIEIPSKLEQRARIHCRKAQPWMLNCMAGAQSNGNYYDLRADVKGGLDGLKRFADVCHQNDVRPCGVTVLTTVEDEVAINQYNGKTAREQVLYYAEELVKAGFTDLVCAPPELDAIRSDSHFNDLSLHTPGIRMAYSPSDDQARTMTPTEAILAGATSLVIGRPITKGLSSPPENLATIAAEVQAALS